ncbi:MAG: polysaccharide export protein [Pirellulaceae bacterium]|nr:polysaccharide export protein [Pirellulaceae bacterium]
MKASGHCVTRPGFFFCCKLITLLAVFGCVGCSTTSGLTLWPNQFPLLPQAKQFSNVPPLPTNLPVEKCKTVLPAYFVEPGDDLLIEPIDFAADLRLTADQRVMVDGSIDLGEYGRLIVTGMTVEQIEALVETRIESVVGKRHAINVRLLEANAAQVYVLGEVGSPAAYPLIGRETVLDAILQAGGLTSRASPCDIVLVRPTNPCDCRVVLPVCYRQITQLGDTTTNYQLQPGDRIYVGGRSLCQELRFWKVNETCERCCNSRCAERDPRRANYLNPFCYLPASPALPWIKGKNNSGEPNEAENDAAGKGQGGEGTLDAVPVPKSGQTQEPLPSTPPATTPATNSTTTHSAPNQFAPTHITPTHITPIGAASSPFFSSRRG